VLAARAAEAVAALADCHLRPRGLRLKLIALTFAILLASASHLLAHSRAWIGAAVQQSSDKFSPSPRPIGSMVAPWASQLWVACVSGGVSVSASIGPRVDG
jgi:hypothetical protein